MPSPLYLAAALSVLLLSACSLHDRQLSGEYPGQALQGKTIAMILADTAHTEVENPAELAAAFPATPGAGAAPVAPKAVLAREFNDYFYREMSRGMAGAKPSRVADTLPPPADSETVAYSRKETWEAPAFTYFVPGRAYLRSHGVEADMVLLISRLRSSPGKMDVAAAGIGGPSGTRILKLEGWYILWDYAANRPVSNGRFRPNQAYSYDPKAEDWRLAFGQAVRMVKDAMPFGEGKQP